MAKRTYLPTLVILARAVLIFVTRYRKQINENLGEGQIALLDALLAALQNLLDNIDLPTGV